MMMSMTLHHHRLRLLSIALIGLALPCSAHAGFIISSSTPSFSSGATCIATAGAAACHVQGRAFRLRSTVGLAMSTTEEQQQQQQKSVPPPPVSRDSWDHEAWANGFSTVETQDCYEIQGDDGVAFPSDLHGTFFQNGHAKFLVGESDIMIHPFDGDGMVSAVTINSNKDGKAWFRNRYVQTPGYIKELQSGKIEYRNMFGTTRNKGKWWSNIFDLTTKNVANTHVLFVPGTSSKSDDKKNGQKNTLYALWEGGRPFEMDPVTLQTRQPGQECDLNGSLGNMDRYAAHYKMDPDTNRVVNFGIGLGDSSTMDINQSHSVTIFEHDLDNDMKLLSKKTYIRSGFGVAHDMAITKNFVVMFQAPVQFDPLPWILGQKSLAQCITQPHDDMSTATTSKLHLFPRDSSISLSPNGKKGDNDDDAASSSPITIDIPMSFTFHTVNAFESSNGKTLSVDAVMTERMFMADTKSTAYPTQPIWDTINYSQDLSPFSIRRYTIDLTTRSLLNVQTMTGSWSKTVDFPTLHPAYVSKPYRYTYVLAGINADHVTPVQGLCKVDVQKGMEIQKWIPPQEYQFLTELVFVPRGDDDSGNSNEEDYGYLVGYLLNGRDRTSSQFVVFDARDISKGPIVQATLKTGLAHALHGTFVKGFTPCIDEAMSSYNK